MKLLTLFLFFTFVVSQKMTCSTYSNANCKGDSTDITFDVNGCIPIAERGFEFETYIQRGDQFIKKWYQDSKCTNIYSSAEFIIGQLECAPIPKWTKCYPYTSTASGINSGSVFLLLSMIALFFGLNQ
eukprot:TRINITY_DN2181_c0_g2_i1.p2 TRINITY_DN2181_c0_g2~~TRINITY_DN2181_c0_g2_i1.p2  ORF type:complete len:128 (+),score=21.42 TRINITY_DN2181_c0_g2_i1:66-449(+)